MSVPVGCDELGGPETLRLCRQVASLVLERLRGLAREAGASDIPLQTLLDELAEEMQAHRDELLRMGAPEGDEAGIRIARSFLPSIAITPGGRPLDRESGIYLAECLWQDAASFYGALVPRASDEASRLVFARSQRSIEHRLAYLRKVILTEPRRSRARTGRKGKA